MIAPVRCPLRACNKVPFNPIGALLQSYSQKKIIKLWINAYLFSTPFLDFWCTLTRSSISIFGCARFLVNYPQKSEVENNPPLFPFIQELRRNRLTLLPYHWLLILHEILNQPQQFGQLHVMRYQSHSAQFFINLWAGKASLALMTHLVTLNWICANPKEWDNRDRWLGVTSPSSSRPAVLILQITN